MQEVIQQMLAKYDNNRVEDYVQALREIMQEIALLGLWRGKFFEKAAFYGGTALRIMHGLDRFSEDLDFSLIEPDPDFNITSYFKSLDKELSAFGFEVIIDYKNKIFETAVQSTFLKANTVNQLLVIQAGEEIIQQIPTGQKIKIKIEIDTDPPGGFSTENKYLLQPIPFSVRTYTLPDLFAGKMHAILCRSWKNRVKGRDWYDLVWYCGYQSSLHIEHLEKRMIQSGHWASDEDLTSDSFFKLIRNRIKSVDLVQAKKEVLPFVRNPESLDIWSKEFFLDIIEKIIIV